MNAETAQLTPAERFYKKHLERVSAYQKQNPEKCREKCKKYNERIRETDPDRYNAVLQQKKDYYLNVRKPKLEALRAEKKQAKIEAKKTAVAV
jgi:hypothetical protein